MRIRIGFNFARALVACVTAAAFLIAPAAAVRAQDHFTITGEVDGLYPGADMTLAARVSNPYPFVIRVTSVAVRVRDASPDCPASMLEVRDSSAAVDVPRNATGTVPLEIRMDPAAPDGCQGATWVLEFTGIAVAGGGSDLPSTSTQPARNLPLLIAIIAFLAVTGLLAGQRRRKTVR